MNRRGICTFLFVLTGFLFLFSGAAAWPAAGRVAAQQEEPVVYLRYDTHIDVREDGSLLIREEQEILFGDAFRTAFAEIPLDHVTEIRNVTLAENGRPYTEASGAPNRPGVYQVSFEEDSIFVEWMYEETSPGETRTFTLEYEVIGGLWVYEDGDVLEWRVVPADRGGAPVRSSTITVSLPPGAAASAETFAFGPDYRTEISDDQVRFTVDEAIPDGTAFQIMVGFEHGLVAASVQPWQRQEDSAELVYSIPQVEVSLQVTANGLIQVTERQTVTVDAGVLYGGQRTIPLAFVDDLAAFAVLEGEIPYDSRPERNAACESCFWVEEQGGLEPWIRVQRGSGQMVIDEAAAGQVHVAWTAPPLVRGEQTTFVIRYTAEGALQLREDAEVLSWTPLSGFDVPVQNARLLLDLPPGIRAQDVTVEGGAAAATGNGRLVIEREQPLPAQEAWQVRLTLPADATSGPAPRWQQEMEAVIGEAQAIQAELLSRERALARQRLAFGVGGLMLLTGGLFAVGIAWYLWGRDSESGVVPEYLSEPPSSLPPGIVAYLLDEKPTPKGVLASLFHLATLGLLRIKLTDPLRIARNWEAELAPGQTIETVDGDTATIPEHMALLFNGLREELSQDPTPLAQHASRLPQIIPQVYYAMGQEASAFFAQLPDEARRRWLVYGQWIVLGGAGLAVAAAIVYAGRVGWVAVLPALALMVVGTALIVVSRWMPQRSAAGAEEAARWRAFERYLRNLQQYGDTAGAQRILERHFAYAVALDVEEVVLAQAGEMGGHVPTWTRPVVLQEPIMGRDSAGRPSVQGPLRREPVASVPGEGGGVLGKRLPSAEREAATPSLAGAAASIASHLEQANASLTNTLQQAVGQGDETPFELVWRGARGAGKLTWKATTTSLEIIDAILDDASSGGGGGSYHGSSGSRSSRSSSSSWGSSRSSSRSRSSGSSSRSSSSRRSGGGGRRGFGR